MLRRFSVNFTLFSMLLDALIVAGAMIGMSYVRVAMNDLPFIMRLPPDIRYPLALYFVFPFLWVGVLAGFSIYDGKKFFKLVDELSTLTAASLVAAIAQAGVLYLSYRDFSRALFVLVVVVSFAVCILWRLAARLVFRLRKETLPTTRKLLIVGSGAELQRVEKVIRQKDPDLFPVVIPFDLKLFSEFRPESAADCPQLIAVLRAQISASQITDVIIALPRSTSAWIDVISSQLEDLALGVWVALDFFDLSLSETRVETLDGLPLLDLRAPALDDYSRILKRAFDLAAGTLALIFFLPLMLLAALLILIDDGWPVLYISDRVGENGALFKIIKFRTMRRGAEKLQHQVEQVNAQGEIIHKLPDDPRVLRSGRLLRRLSIDELPQLINVLKGDMSIVGPRPELPYLVDHYAHWQRRRLSVPPGITGWWQVNGRSDRVMHLHTEDDIYYVENYSIWLDLRILIRTVWVVLIGKGSY